MGADGLHLSCRESTKCRTRGQQIDSGSMPLHRCMSLSIPCCGEARLQLHGPGQWVQMGCTCPTVSLRSAGRVASRLIQAPCLCTGACLCPYHAVVRPGCSSMDQSSGGRWAADAVLVCILHCRQTWAAGCFRYQACAQHHGARPPCCGGEEQQQHGPGQWVQMGCRCCIAVHFTLQATWAADCFRHQACAQHHGARPPCCGGEEQQQHGPGQWVQMGCRLCPAVDRQSWAADCSRHQAWAQHHDARPPCCGEAGVTSAWTRAV